jgi:BASS family bile acid:Na+ symporter
VALSITMTAVSTVVAVVAMPVVLALYGGAFTEASFALPLKDIAVTLVVILLPVALGMAIRSRSVSAARIVEKVGSGAGIGVLVLLIVSALVNHSATFVKIPIGGYLAAIALGTCGIGLGWLAAWTLPVAQRRAVAFETGIQNSPLAIAIILATFPGEMADEMLWLPLLYALAVLVVSSAIAVGFRMRGSSVVS